MVPKNLPQVAIFRMVQHCDLFLYQLQRVNSLWMLYNLRVFLFAHFAVFMKIDLGCSIRRIESSILTLIIMLQVKIDVSIHIQPRNGVEILKKKEFWGWGFLPENWLSPPLGWKKNIHKYRVHCIQKNQLSNTISTKQLIRVQEA